MPGEEAINSAPSTAVICPVEFISGGQDRGICSNIESALYRHYAKASLARDDSAILVMSLTSSSLNSTFPRTTAR